MPDRYFAPDLAHGASEYLLLGSEAHHLGTVCRAKIGTAVVLFNGSGLRALATVIHVERKAVLLSIESTAQSPAPLPRIVGVALPKGDRSLVLIEKGVELGLTEIVPVQAERSVTNPGEGKLDRFERAVIEASKQSGRDYLLRIGRPLSATDFFKEGVGWMLDAEGEPILECTSSVPSRFAIGPEGGWTDQEREQARSLGWRLIRISQGILRVETACIALASIVEAHLLSPSSITPQKGAEP